MSFFILNYINKLMKLDDLYKLVRPILQKKNVLESIQVHLFIFKGFILLLKGVDKVSTSFFLALYFDLSDPHPIIIIR
ncbi:hypothetical protein CWR48_02830 [Oceanobacillus arenosus]|uniref:Uncharacterized protein n=1 Tax=Oceanobacillus arenosus TaxID=1229153 RepID=A0A3D8Q0L4_9BACI|nr:hypothetical protein CWR48_02830 [Oceanobacillus arenosus]